MIEGARAARDFLAVALAIGFLGISGVMVVVVAQRLIRDARDRWRERCSARYAPIVAEALDAVGPTRARAVALLATAPKRHREIVATVMIGPLRVVRGTQVDQSRALAEDVGLLAEWRARLGDRSWAVRARSALALGLVQDVGAVPLLVARLEDPHDQVRAAAVDALGNVGDPAATAALLSCLSQQTRHQQARLVEALRRLGPSVTEAIVSRGTQDAGERVVIAELLEHVGGAGARASLLAWTSDPEPRVRAAAWQAIATVGVGDRAAYYALRALGDVDARVRADAARALGRTGRGDLAPYLAAHLDDEWEVAAQGARALTWLGEPGLAALRARQTSDAAGHGRELARHFLWEHDRP